MTAVEWLWNALLVSGFEEIKNVEGFYHLAKQKEKEQKYSEEEVRKAIELARETELKTGGYDPRPFTSDKYSKQEIINQLKSE